MKKLVLGPTAQSQHNLSNSHNFPAGQGNSSDKGAEDESVLPIIQSQVRIDHVEKIIVKQSKGIEGTYYYIVKVRRPWRQKS